jgi:hypothetical protein
VDQGVFVLAAFAAFASRLLLLAGGVPVWRALTGHRGRLVTALPSSGVMTVPVVRMLVAPS